MGRPAKRRTQLAAPAAGRALHPVIGSVVRRLCHEEIQGSAQGGRTAWARTIASGPSVPRRAELEELTADIRNGQNTVVFAPRRYGKTSLVWRAAQQLVTEGVLVAQVDLMRTPTKERLAERLSEAIHEQIASPLLRAADRLRVFASLRVRPTVIVDPQDGSTSFSFSARVSGQDIDRTLEELLVLPAELAARRNRRVAVVFDEFQEIVDIDERLVNLMRSVIQEQPEVAHVFLGSRRHMMERIFNDENEPFWRSAK